MSGPSSPGSAGATPGPDPLTDRAALDGAYADDRKLRSRIAIWDHADAPAPPGWRTSFVDWDGSQIVVDVGSGTGRDAARLVDTRRCARLVAVDVSLGMLRAARDHVPRRTTHVQGDAQHLPLRNASADVALAMHMLYHIPDLDTAVLELRRVLRPGGTLLASTNGATALSEIWNLFDGVASLRLGRIVRSQPTLRFTTEEGAGLLERSFADVILHERDEPLSLPSSELVVAYLESIREALLARVGSDLDFDATLEEVAARVEDQVRRDGSFRAHGHWGVFVCR